MLNWKTWVYFFMIPIYLFVFTGCYFFLGGWISAIIGVVLTYLLAVPVFKGALKQDWFK